MGEGTSGGGKEGKDCEEQVRGFIQIHTQKNQDLLRGCEIKKNKK